MPARARKGLGRAAVALLVAAGGLAAVAAVDEPKAQQKGYVKANPADTKVPKKGKRTDRVPFINLGGISVIVERDDGTPYADIDESRTFGTYTPTGKTTLTDRWKCIGHSFLDGSKKQVLLKFVAIGETGTGTANPKEQVKKLDTKIGTGDLNVTVQDTTPMAPADTPIIVPVVQVTVPPC